jgi:hypothetical protein
MELPGSTGQIVIDQADLYCVGEARVADTTEAQFLAAVKRAAPGGAQPPVLEVAGALELSSPQDWAGREWPLAGNTTIAGTSPLATLDFAHKEPFVLSATSGPALTVRDLWLSNLPVSQAADNRTVAALAHCSAFLWLGGEASVAVVAQQRLPERRAVGSVAMVDCAEVEFLQQWAEALQSDHGSETDWAATFKVCTTSLPSTACTRPCAAACLDAQSA